MRWVSLFADLLSAGLNRSPATLVVGIVLILDVAVLVAVLAGKGSVRHKVLWSGLVLLLPVVGLILYFVVGRTRADRPLME